MVGMSGTTKLPGCMPGYVGRPGSIRSLAYGGLERQQCAGGPKGTTREGLRGAKAAGGDRGYNLLAGEPDHAVRPAGGPDGSVKSSGVENK